MKKEEMLDPEILLSIMEDLKETQEELIRAKEKAENYLDISGVMIIALDKAARVTLINKTGCNILGYTAKELIGKNWFECCLPQKNIKEVKKVFRQCMEGETKLVRHYENPIYTLKGEERIISWNNALLKDDKGGIIGTLSSGEDITEKKEAEDKIQKLNEELKKRVKFSEEKYQILYQTSADAIMTLAPPTWKFTAGNPTTIKMFETKDEKDFISKGPWDVSPEHQPDKKLSSEKAKEMIGIAMKKGSNFFEWTHKRLGGSDFPATVLLTKVEIEKGKPFLQATVRDITEQKKAEWELKKSYEKLKELDVLKSRFLTVTSHELKTPLTPAKIQTQMLLQGDLGKLTGKQKQSFEIILRNINRLNELIGDILEIARIESEGFKLKPEKLQVENCIGLIVKSMTPVAENKGLKLIYKESKLPLIMADKKRITEVITNLIENALKFTEKGQIIIETEKHKDNILVKVRDSGMGIPKKYLKTVFSQFFQIEPTYTRRYGGTGLGLNICKGIIEQHGGKIWVESELNKGSTFYFTLPLKKV
jgi:PAS domain S-box-containing protein